MWKPSLKAINYKKMIKNKTYLDYLQRKVDNQVGYDCRQKLKEAELQNFFMVLSKTVSTETFSLRIPKMELKIPGKLYLKSESRTSVSFKS